jgi:hypothetical protein
MTRLARAEADVDKAQAALTVVEGVLHTAVKAQTTARRSRKLLRTVGVLVVVGVAVGVGVVVVRSLTRKTRPDVEDANADQ